VKSVCAAPPYNHRQSDEPPDHTAVIPFTPGGPSGALLDSLPRKPSFRCGDRDHNASRTEPPQLAAHRGCIVIRRAENPGFARAVNTDGGLADSDWICHPNSDVTLEPHWLERLIAASPGSSFAPARFRRRQTGSD